MSDVTAETQVAKKFDPEAFAMNLARAMESSGQALAAYLKPRESGEITDKPPGELAEVIKTFSAVAEYWLSDKDRSAELQMKIGKAYLDLWGSAVRRLAGEQAEPAIAPSPHDKRFNDPEWKSNQFFDFVMQLYLLTTQWAQDLVRNAEGLDPHTRKKADFYVQQIANALAPSNFVLTNPEVLRETLASSGDNLVRGMKMLAEDIEAGGGMLRIRQSDPSNLVVGVNMATTPGKVIFQNELMQLIQYQPSTENVLRTPLLIVPPWINKFYILDLRPEKSFVKWCVDQGITVFMISWVNPDKRLGSKTFDDYMKEGPLAAMDAIEKTTGELKVHTMGYCVGGTLLASTLAWLAEKRRVRVTSATFLAAQVDFTHAGDLLVFVDEGQISALERDMQAAGVVEGEGADLQSGDARGSYRPGGFRALQLAIFRRPGEVRTVRIRAYCRRGQPASVGQVPVLDQRQCQGCYTRRLAQGRAGAQGLVVARLARMACRHRRRGGAGARGRHRGVASDRGRARQLRPGPRIAQQSTFEYNRSSPPGRDSKSIEGNAYDARIVLADADGHFHRIAVDPLYHKSLSGSWPLGRDGQSIAQRQAACGVGHSPDVLA